MHREDADSWSVAAAKSVQARSESGTTDDVHKKFLGVTGFATGDGFVEGRHAVFRVDRPETC